MVAAFLVNRGDPLVAAFEDDRAALTDMLKAICQSYTPGCSRCSEKAAG
jgi:hypothetical protein